MAALLASQAMAEQVVHDQGLIRERVQQLSGRPGLERLDAALAAARAATTAELENSDWETDRYGCPLAAVLEC